MVTVVHRLDGVRKSINRRTGFVKLPRPPPRVAEEEELLSDVTGNCFPRTKWKPTACFFLNNYRFDFLSMKL